MKENFLDGVDYIVTNYEGGFAHNKKDPGGATYQGVTQRVYDAARRQVGKPLQSVQYMSIQERTDIYREQFWNAIHGDASPSGVDFVLLDDAINSGPVGATKRLQEALGLKADGHWGLVTSQTLDSVTDFEGLIRRLCSLRLGFLENLGTWRYFSGGWSRRVADVQRVALSAFKMGTMKMVKAPPKITPKEKKLFDGIWTIAVGLIVAIAPSALQYLVGVDWTHLLGPNAALFVSGALMAIFRMVQNTDTKVATKL